MIKLHSVINIGSIVILILLYFNLYSACAYTISCESFLPTLSFIGTLRGHDTFFVLTLTFQSILLIPLFSAFHAYIDDHITKDDYIFLKLQEFAIVPLIVFEGIIDESVAIDFFPADDVHRYITFTLCGLSISWIF